MTWLNINNYIGRSPALTKPRKEEGIEMCEDNPNVWIGHRH